MKIAFVYGTRPEIIKMCPLIRYCDKNEINYFLIHSGQHYSYNMDKLFFEQLELNPPEYKLNIKSSAPYRQGEHTGKSKNLKIIFITLLVFFKLNNLVSEFYFIQINIKLYLVIIFDFLIFFSNHYNLQFSPLVLQ